MIVTFFRPRRRRLLVIVAQVAADLLLIGFALGLVAGLARAALAHH